MARWVAGVVRFPRNAGSNPPRLIALGRAHLPPADQRAAFRTFLAIFLPRISTFEVTFS
jgi:hypothetical protein